MLSWLIETKVLIQQQIEDLDLYSRYTMLILYHRFVKNTLSNASNYLSLTHFFSNGLFIRSILCIIIQYLFCYLHASFCKKLLSIYEYILGALTTIVSVYKANNVIQTN